MAELKEEDIISHTATATQLPTAAAGVSGDTFRILSELHYNDGRVPLLLCTHYIHS